MGCLRILLRKTTGTSILPFRDPSDDSASDVPAPVSLPPSATDVILSSDGALALSIEGDDSRAVVRSTATGAEAHLSQEPFPNLCVYRVADGVRVAAWHQKLFDREKWPYVQWSDDETVAARLTKAEICFYDTTGPEAAPPAIGKPPYARHRVAGAAAFRLAPTGKHVAAFVPAGASSPGRLLLYAVPSPARGGDAPSADEGRGDAQIATEPLASRSTFKADAVEYAWNSPGTSLLATTSTSTDASGKSYYGESALYFATLKGEPRMERLALPKEGPVFAASWNAQGNSFAVVYGSTPARATLFTAAAKPVFDYGTGPRNTALFAPSVASRRLVLAGFGNLPGGVEVWDKVAAARVGAFDTDCATAYGWAPDGRLFLAATTFPRLRVDNGYAIYRYDGSVVERVAFPEGEFLLQATFVPTLPADLPRRPKSPDRAAAVAASAAAAGAAGKPHAPAAAVPRPAPAVEAYRPPGLRGRAPAFKLHETVEAGKVTGGVFGSGGEGAGGTKSQTISVGRPKRVIAGLTEEDTPAPGGMTKSQRKNAKKKEKAAREKAAGGAAAAPAKPNGAAARGAVTAEASAPPPPTVAALDVESLTTVEEVQKKLRGVSKKLRAVESLAADQAVGKELQAEQVVKLGSAGALRDQLAALETRLAALGV